MKFRLIRPNYKRDRIIEATDMEDLIRQLTGRFGLYRRLNVFWAKNSIIVGKITTDRGGAGLYVRWQWKEQPAEFPESIVDFFDPDRYWIQWGVPPFGEGGSDWWTDFSLEIIGGVE